jgi:L-alanine-DL-glutamate epimerase-like enolase superfamily enzyme
VDRDDAGGREVRAGGTLGIGYTYAHLAETKHVPLSAHTAPALHLHACCALRPVVHLEHFDDHVRIEQRLFDGVVPLAHGALRPDRSRPGLGIELKRAEYPFGDPHSRSPRGSVSSFACGGERWRSKS